MPEDLKTLLERADAPTMHVDPHAVLAGGRRRHRRRAGMASAALAATVGVLAVGAATWGDLGPDPVRPAAATSTATSSQSSTRSAPSPRPVTARVVLDVGHCWVEDVVFDGQTWGLTEQQQLGTGGGMPSGWQGEGLMVRLSEDRARYTDDGGKKLTFLPISDPTVFRPRICA